MNSQHPYTPIFTNSNSNKNLKLHNHVLVWNVTDWNALLSVKIFTTS